jgi:hypothetical protein
MRRLLGFGALLAAACASGPDQAFDTGSAVHVIVVAERPPAGGTGLQAVATLGEQTHRSEVALGGEEPAAREIAIFRASRGKHRFSFLDELSRAGVRGDVKVEGERWIVVRLEGARARLRVFEEPPDDVLGDWRRLVAVPD